MFGEFGASVTSADRRAVQDQLEELVWSANSADADTDRRHCRRRSPPSTLQLPNWAGSNVCTGSCELYNLAVCCQVTSLPMHRCVPMTSVAKTLPLKPAV